jgi:hypothetical protein
MSEKKTAEDYKAYVMSIIALIDDSHPFFCIKGSSQYGKSYFQLLLPRFFCIYSLGNEAFLKKDFKAAIEFYTKAILQEKSNHIFFSNRR